LLVDQTVALTESDNPPTQYSDEYDRLVELGFDKTTAARVATAPALTEAQAAVLRAAFRGVHS
jgi:predicted DNA binding protein